MMQKTKKLARPVDVIGVGISEFGVSNKLDSPTYNATTRELWTQAAARAIEDAGVPVSAIDALYVGNMSCNYHEGGQYNLGYVMDMWTGLSMGEDLWKSAVRIDDACCSSSHAIRQAVLAVASGMYDVVIAGGVENAVTKWSWKNPAVPISMDIQETLTSVYGHMDQGWELPQMQMLDHILSQWLIAYIQQYKLSVKQLFEMFDARIISNLTNGSLTPGNFFTKTPQQVASEAGYSDIREFLASPENNPFNTWPVRRWDYTRRCDGAAAVIVCSEDISRQAKSVPIHYLGTGNAIATTSFSRDMYRMPFVEEAGKEAYAMAGVSPSEIGVVEMFDFGPAEHMPVLEDLGYWKCGESYEMLVNGETFYTGSRPVNPSSGGVTCGVVQGTVGAICLSHMIRQLRGDAGSNQVPALPGLGMVYDCGGARNSVIHILGR